MTSVIMLWVFTPALWDRADIPHRFAGCLIYVTIKLRAFETAELQVISIGGIDK